MATFDTLLGVGVGWALNDLSQFIKQHQEYKKVKNAIKLEIGRNNNKMIEFWEKLNQQDLETETNSDFEDESGDFYFPDNSIVIKTEIPRWSSKIWDSQITTLSMALNIDEFNGVYQYYESLSLFEKKFIKFRSFFENPRLTGNIDQEVRDLWKEMKDMVKSSEEYTKSIKHKFEKRGTYGNYLQAGKNLLDKVLSKRKTNI